MLKWHYGSKESKYYIYQISEHLNQQYCEAEKKILELNMLKAVILRQDKIIHQLTLLTTHQKKFKEPYNKRRQQCGYGFV